MTLQIEPTERSAAKRKKKKERENYQKIKMHCVEQEIE